MSENEGRPEPREDIPPASALLMLRHRLRWTQAQVALNIGIDVQTYRAIEHGHRHVSCRVRERVNAYVQRATDACLAGVEPPPKEIIDPVPPTE